MNSSVNELIRSVTGKNSLGECSMIELQQIANQYPYFGPAQFLLSQKLKEEGSLEYDAHLQKTSLYFPNQLWLDLLINGPANNEMTIMQETKKLQKEEAGEFIPEEPVINEEQLTEAAIIPEKESGEIILIKEEEPVEEINKEEEQSSVQQKLATEQQESLLESETTAIIDEEVIEATIEEPLQENKEDEFIASEINEPATDSTPIETYAAEEKPAEQISGLLNSPETQPIEETQEAKEEITDLVNEEQQPLPELPQLKIEPINDPGKVLTFEPYHTVDYFASQGIRFREEEKPKDRFGQQLKSFTEWLKALKRLPDSQVVTSPPSTTDQKVEQMAQQSLVDRNVITEAMADVWEKQGNFEKAIDIYNKLSLSDPAKSSYFAAKIEHLKNL